ncbi:hypothetical protein [Mesorhizobium sp.]|uniref:hypothetical protein n=1 Tax=Mesorhizobium sp. TaxID=1871066 RepID=UPI00257D923A|nr:hypothetical protein [Mesorhizobium sp.]
MATATWETLAGTVELRIPKLRKKLLARFPRSVPHGREALPAVIHEASVQRHLHRVG